MKINGVPDKLYLLPNGFVSYFRNTDKDVEYTCTDAFIEKAWEWVEDNILSSSQQDKSLLYYKQFKNYMEGEKV